LIAQILAWVSIETINYCPEFAARTPGFQLDANGRRQNSLGAQTANIPGKMP
jgi:hypothetical protein